MPRADPSAIRPFPARTLGTAPPTITKDWQPRVAPGDHRAGALTANRADERLGPHRSRRRKEQ